MAQRKGFPLRIDPAIHDALQRWADAEMRSMNAQIEFLLRGALKKAGRLPKEGNRSENAETSEEGGTKGGAGESGPIGSEPQG